MTMATADAIRARQDQAHGGWMHGRVVNVGQTERLASQVGGGVLVAAGLLQGGLKGLILAGLGGALVYRGATGHCDLYEALGANTADEERGPRDSVPARAGTHVVEAVTIGRAADELYRAWRDYTNFPRFMEHIESVTALDQNRSHWVACGPLDQRVEWDAEIIEERPGEMLAWRSLSGDVETAGSIHFIPAPGGRATEVRVNLRFNPPLAGVGTAVAKLFGRDPATATRENLRRFKQLMETGEILRSNAG